MGIAWSRVAQSLLALIINCHYTGELLGYGVYEQLKDCLPSFITGALMVVVVMLSDHWIEVGGLIELLLLTMIGACFYIGSNFMLGGGALKEAATFITGRRL